jgi:hypothetical protein
MLTLSSRTARLVVYSDASKKGLGCVLIQHGTCNSLELVNLNYMTYIRSYQFFFSIYFPEILAGFPLYSLDTKLSTQSFLYL